MLYCSHYTRLHRLTSHTYPLVAISMAEVLSDLVFVCVATVDALLSLRLASTLDRP